MDYASEDSTDSSDTAPTITITKKTKKLNKKTKKRKQIEYSDGESEDEDGIAIKKHKKDKQKYNYIPSCISLKTTDESVIYNVLPTNKTAYTKPQLDSTIIMQNYHGRDQILAKITDIFSSNECAEIIKQSESLNAFQNLNKSNKYNARVRKSDRLLVLDDKLSTLLWNRLNNVIKHDIIDTYNLSTTPLGFGVDNKWNVSSINIAMRINKYDSNNDDFFTFHKDAQYCPSADQRSIFTLIIYLNDDFEGGETNFYFNKNDNKDDQMLFSACTISEEMEHFGGINGYECEIIKPSIGDGIIFSQDIIHEGCALQTPDKYKYIIKTDIVAERKCKAGFAISSEESLDYQRCLNYFTQAQREELKGNEDKANELYERSLSLRYSYPNTSFLRYSHPQLQLNIDAIWLIIFDYCHIREMEYISYLFPNQLYRLLTGWKLMYDKQTRNVADKDFNDIDNLSIPFIPRLISEVGCYHTFEFNDYNFFIQNEDDCCRVAAMYAFVLMSHVKDTKYFIVQYDSLTQNVMAVPLSKLLKDVFYNRQCNGSYFKIKKQNSDDVIKCFNANVDRDYMSIVHGSHFVGGVGLLSDKQYGHYISCGVTGNCYCDAESMMDGSVSDQEEEFVGKWNDFMTAKGWPNDDKVHKMRYIDELMDMKNKQIACSKTQLLKHRKYEKQYNVWDEIDYGDDDIHAPRYRENWNHLVFDFSKNRLEVNKNKKILSGTECRNCLSLDLERVIHQHMSRKNLDYPNLKYYTINIKSLFKDGEWDLGFNHASCHADSHEVGVNATIDSDLYFGYNHTTHVHITAIKTNDNKLRMWISYNGISAM